MEIGPCPLPFERALCVSIDGCYCACCPNDFLRASLTVGRGLAALVPRKTRRLAGSGKPICPGLCDRLRRACVHFLIWRSKKDCRRGQSCGRRVNCGWLRSRSAGRWRRQWRTRFRSERRCDGCCRTWSRWCLCWQCCHWRWGIRCSPRSCSQRSEGTAAERRIRPKPQAICNLRKMRIVRDLGIYIH